MSKTPVYNFKFNLPVLAKMISDLELEPSKKAKKAIIVAALKASPDVRNALVAAYDNRIQFWVTSRHAKPAGPSLFSHELTVEGTLDRLYKRALTGGAALNVWAELMSKFTPYFQDILCRVLDRDLRCRCALKTFNAALEEAGLEPIWEFEVSLGFPYDGAPVWEDTVGWFMSRKYDGARCVAKLVRGKKIQLLSRTGKPFNTLGCLEELFARALRDPKFWVGGDSLILDGEIALRNDAGADDFQGLMKLLMRDDYQIPGVAYHVFDSVRMDDDCETPIDDAPLSERIARYEEMAERANLAAAYLLRIGGRPSAIIRPVNQVSLESAAQLAQARARAKTKGWEGLILRRDVPYAVGRSEGMWKVKEFHEDEYEVIGIKTGSMQIAVLGVGEKKILTMKSATILQQGCEVEVGSGWTVEQRKRYYKNPDDIIGRLITVQHFGVTENQGGTFSLRFPVFKALHGVDRVV
jgi:DNA ligase 1